MARQVVVLALVLFVVVQVAYADDIKVEPFSLNTDDDLSEPPTGNIIGTLELADADSPSSLRAAPLSGPMPPGVFDVVPKSDASALQSSAIVGAGVATLIAFLYF